MSSIYGNNIRISLFGESHNDYIGATIDGLPSGIKLDINFIKAKMNLRKSNVELATPRIEEDDFEIISGFYNGFTTGTPLTVLIKNKNVDSTSYTSFKDVVRPGHVDYVSYLKYHGFEDNRGSGHFLGRLTTPLVFVGAIALQILKEKGINIGSHLYQVYDIFDDEIDYENINNLIEEFNNSYIPTCSKTKKQLMENAIKKAKQEKDSLGGIIESIITFENKNIVLGEPYFDSIESKISALLFSLGGVKGVSFGLGFDFANKKGSEVKDEWIIKNENIVSKNNYNGGINGGISNLQPIVLKTVFKPTSSIGLIQNTVNIKTKKEECLVINGRHDPCILLRARVVVDSLIALALIDLMCFRHGNEWLR